MLLAMDMVALTEYEFIPSVHVHVHVVHFVCIAVLPFSFSQFYESFLADFEHK